ncbi:MAG TPA: hypothetical protein VM639_12910 [Dongiaceae bacterium]|nr:hypothetical protein [Dongiaceae bacterium]
MKQTTPLSRTRSAARTAIMVAPFLAAALGFAQIPAAQAQNTSPTAVQGPDGEVPAPDKKPTPPLTFPPSSACAFHGKPDCEQKIHADAIENKSFGRTGVKGGAPATSSGSAFGSNATPSVAPLGGLSSGNSSSSTGASSSGLGGLSSGSSTNPQSIGNTSAGTPSPSGTGNGAPQMPSSGGSVGGSVPAGGGSSSGGSSGGL